MSEKWQLSILTIWAWGMILLLAFVISDCAGFGQEGRKTIALLVIYGCGYQLKNIAADQKK